MAHQPECTLLVVERSALTDNMRVEQVETLEALKAEVADTLPWVALEALGNGVYRQWAPEFVLLLGGAFQAEPDAKIINQLDSFRPQRPWSQSSLRMCAALTADEQFMTRDEVAVRAGLLRSAMIRSLKKGGVVVSLTIMACAAAAAACTGMGAVAIASSIAESMLSSGSGALVDVLVRPKLSEAAAAPAAPAATPADPELKSRVEHLESLLVELEEIRTRSELERIDELQARIDELGQEVAHARQHIFH